MAAAKTLEQTKSRQEKAMDAIQKTIDKQAQILLSKDGRFHRQLDGGFYGIIVGAKSIHAKTPEELKAKIVEHLVRQLALKMITPKSSLARWRAEILESRRLFPSASMNEYAPIQKMRKNTDETGLLDQPFPE